MLAGRHHALACPTNTPPDSGDSFPSNTSPLTTPQNSKSWKPGAAEVARGVVNRTMDPRLLRDRHVVLPMDALKEKLLRIAAVGRSRERYIAQQAQQLHYSELQEDGRLHIRCIPNRRPPTGPCSQAAVDAARKSGGSGQPQLPAVAQAPAGAPAGSGAAGAPASSIETKIGASSDAELPLEDMPMAEGGTTGAPAAAAPAAPAAQRSSEPAVPPAAAPQQQQQQPASQQQQQQQQPPAAQQQQQQPATPGGPPTQGGELADEAALLGSTPAQPAAAATAAAHVPAEAAPASLWNGKAFRYGPPGVAALSAIALLAAAAAVYCTLRRRADARPPPVASTDDLDDIDAETKPLTAVTVQLPALSRPTA